MCDLKADNMKPIGSKKEQIIQLLSLLQDIALIYLSPHARKND